MKRRLWAAVAVLLGLSCAVRAQSSATFKGVDVYRSETLTPEAIDAAAGPLIQNYLHLRESGDNRSLKGAERIKAQIESRVRALGNFAFLNLYYGEYANSAERTTYLTFDVVDVKDAATRMPFRAAPVGRVPDPGGLLAAWQQYFDLGTTLMGQGQLSTDHPECPAFFCLWGSQTAELGALEKRFVQEAAPRQEALLKVLRGDADPQKRMNALFVLSYLPDGKQVATVMMEGLTDRSDLVRGAALQVLSDIALYHHTVFLDVAKIIPVLDFPTTSDRSKALGTMVGLADNPAYRPFVLSRGSPYLVGLLKMNQPCVQDLAYALLTILSKESYDRRDYDSWQKWVQSQSH